MKLNIINACSDLGVNIDGSSLGPSIIKKNLKDKEEINKIVDVVCDCSNKSNDKKDMKKNLDKLNHFNEELYNKIYSLNDDNAINLTIGGDHSIVISSSLASISKRENLGIIWFDTHPDFNTFETTKTGNIHGLPLATISNNNGNILTKFHKGSFFKNENVAILGARDIDPLEGDLLKKYSIKTILTDDIKKDLEHSVLESIKVASNNTQGIHLSIDLDVIDPIIAPGISVGFKNGLTKQEFFSVIDLLLKEKDLIKSIDIVEFNPLNDKNNKTLDIALELIEKIINTYSHYN